MDIGRVAHLQYDSAFLLEEHDFAFPESTFFRVETQLIFAEFPENFFQVCHMLGYALRLDDYVVHIYLDILSDLLFKDSVHQSLVCCAYAFESKRHDPISEIGIFRDECCFLLVWSLHSNLVVPGVGVQEA